MRQSRLFFAATSLAVLLTACGYSPLYAPGEGAVAAPQKVSVGTVEMSKTEAGQLGQRRVAQTVAQRLKLAYPLESSGADQLMVVVQQTENALAVERTSTLKRAQITLAAELELTSAEGTRLLKAGVNSTAAYNVENSPYSTESGKTFAELTAARNLADEITRRIALYYRTQSLKPVQGVVEEPSPTAPALKTVSLTVPLPLGKKD